MLKLTPVIPPVRVGLPQNLLTGDAATTQVGDNVIANAQAWLDQVKADLNLTQGEVTMFVSDMPNVPPQNVPVMIAQANQAQAGDQQARDRALGICSPVPSNYYGGENTLSPLVSVKNYFTLYDPKTTFTGPATLTVLQQPQHGVLRLMTEADRGVFFSDTSGPIDPNDPGYIYLPEKGYLGDDKASFLIERGGIKVKVVYYFKAVNGPLGNTGAQEHCKDTGKRWKISSTLDTNGASTITSVEYQSPAVSTAGSSVVDTVALASTLGSSVLSNLDGDTAGVNLSIADLTGGALGQTVGSNITLDTNAAAYNRFIDATQVLVSNAMQTRTTRWAPR